MVCGLAIYNGVNLDLPFPLIVYKKLLGGKGIQLVPYAHTHTTVPVVQ